MKEISRFLELYFLPPKSEYMEITEKLVSVVGPLFVKLVLDVSICIPYSYAGIVLIEISDDFRELHNP